MMENIPRRLHAIGDTLIRRALELLLTPLYDRVKSCALSSAGLVISATTTKAKIGASVFHYVAYGVLGRIAAGTDMPVLVGTVTNALFNVFIFTVDKDGTTYVQMGTEGATEAAIVWPELDQTRAIIGVLVINPTGTGDFVGGTTPLGDATVIPNAAYISPIGAFDPTTKTE